MPALRLAAFLLLVSWAWPWAAGASEDRAPAATAALPPALLAIPSGADAIVSASAAHDARAHWILTLNLPLVAAVVQGQGPFEMNVLTVSGGIFAGAPVLVRVRVGR